MSSGPHALIVEDELIIAVGLQSLLAEFGFTSFAFASTERQALEQARLCCPDLITIDLGLMAGDGAAAMRAIDDECGPLPVIYVTGSPTAVADARAAAVLAKPVSRAALAEVLRRLDCLADQHAEKSAEGSRAAAPRP